MLNRFFAFYKPYKWLFIADFTCAILAALVELAFPLAVNRVIDDYLPAGNWSTILSACLVLMGIFLLSAFFHYIVTYWGHKLGINIESDMRKQAFNKVQKLPNRFFDNNKTGHLVSRMTNDLMDIGEIAHHGPEDLFIAFMTLIGAFSLMMMINPQLAILTFIVIPFLLILSIYFSKKMAKTFDRFFRDIADFNARVENNVSGIRVVKAFANEDHEIAQFAVNNERFRTTKLIAYKVMAWNASISHFLIKGVSIFVLACGTWFVINNKMTFGEFMAFILLSNIFIGPINQINSVIETYPKGIAGFKRFMELLDTPEEIEDTKDAVTIDKVEGEIAYNNVSFGYTEDKMILNQVNFNVRKGESVAFVGPSGGGKTTI